MTTKVIIDNHARFNLVVDSVENGKIVNTTVIPVDQERYETIVHSSKSIVIEEGDVNKPFDFGKAIKHLKAGKKLARSSWNGKGLSIELQKPDQFSKMTLPYIFINYPSVPASDSAPHDHINAKVPWQASQTDVLAEDWLIVA